MPSEVRWFRDVTIADVPVVGGKNASLGEMVRELGAKGVRVPDGFALTADAFRRYLDANRLVPAIRQALDGLDLDRVDDLQDRGRRVRALVLGGKLPDDLAAAIVGAYRKLGGVDVAVRSSATAEDLPEASFAGQQETFLNVHGESAVLEAVRRCYASLFTDRAISYRAERGYDPLSVALSVGVQRMVRSDLACSGVLFTIDTETGFKDVVLVSGAWGLGENVVQGTVDPDEWTVFKPTLATGSRPIVRRSLGTKQLRMVYAEAGGSGRDGIGGGRGAWQPLAGGGLAADADDVASGPSSAGRSEVGGAGRTTKNLPTSPADQGRFCLTDDEVLELARMAVVVEAHYTGKHGRPTPMDLEWAKDGRTGELFVVQARPETVQSRKVEAVAERWHLQAKGKPLVTGRAVGEKIGAGRVRVVRDASEMSAFRDGDVLVAERTDPDWEPVMRRASAIVTDHGGRTCHAAIVSRELGKPAVVGAGDATTKLKDGADVTVSCAEGEQGVVYEGRVPYEVDRVDLSALGRPKTKVMMNVGNPAEAFSLAQLPNDGVGLLREEFVISSHIGIHPMALVDYAKLADPAVKAEIDRRTAGWTDKTAFFVDRLAEGVGTIAAAFFPKDVIVRLSDFKTNEYANLIGGKPYEPVEENPMLGFRGASRYYDSRYRDAFALECRALLKVRREMGLKNLKVMVPFCRTVAEGRAVVAEMAKHGLVRGQDGLEVYVMCEIPANVILADKFADVFDGFSIGSNDLTQLVLGVDRDSEIVAPLFDERNEAVGWAIGHAIATVKAKGRKIGICGQAPSDHPEMVRDLIEAGIDSVSLTPDAVPTVTAKVLEVETELAKRR